MEQTRMRPLVEVWGDTVDLRELFLAVTISVVVTMALFLAGSRIFLAMENLDEGLAKGYSLLVGITGCILSAVVTAKLFQPKRIVEERLEQADIEEILEMAGLTLAQEIEGLTKLEPATIAEMEELELYSLLALIPEGAPNYDPKYKQKILEEA